ncbi:hypothetical protein FOQG_13634 [Fusarium oxysporum f. sp. raphani 54005]|uniref:Uncharacterized protein n=2 Tax=Fusarium oxysporum TaxID=5507 RepID=X0CHA8_FUSOX|nr:hypothetical protein FOQG_13634 [Fusarium oxysporum f. sp. raphani 54005]EXL74241.1 hypothetical protein FOPG_10662 [Fusarium oxysporum f. sp. conglutinans race 2 54008]
MRQSAINPMRLPSKKIRESHQQKTQYLNLKSLYLLASQSIPPWSYQMALSAWN